MKKLFYKKIGLFMFAIAIIVSFYAIVDAMSDPFVKELDDVVYVYEEIEPFVCSLNEDTYLYPFLTFDDGLVYANEETEEVYLLNIDGEATELDEEALKNKVINGELVEIEYDMEEDDDNNINIIKTIDAYKIYAYVRNEDEEFVADTWYGKLNNEGFISFSNGSSVGPDAVPSDYFKELVVTYPTTEGLTAGVTYYKKIVLPPETLCNEILIEKVTSPVAEDFDEYYVVAPEDEESLVCSFPAEDFEAINDVNMDSLYITDVITVGDTSYLVLALRVGSTQKSFLYNFDGSRAEIFGYDQATAFMQFDEFIQIVNGGLSATDDFTAKVFNQEGQELLNFKDEYVVLSLKGEDNDSLLLTYTPSEADEDDDSLENLPISFYKLYKYSVLNGNNQNYSDGNLTVRFSGELEKLLNVKVDDEIVDENNYTTASGSTIITLKQAFLNTLDDGEHEILVKYNDGGYASAGFTTGVKNPPTYDNVLIMVIMAVVCAVGIICICQYKKQDSIKI